LKKMSLIAAAGFVFLLAIMISGAAGNVEIKGITTDVGVPEFTWTNATFPGFYSDIDKNLGAEQITFRLSNVYPTIATLSDQPDANNNRGIVYTTQAQIKTFKYKPWGQYDVIGFLGDKYFAGYDSSVTSSVADAGEHVAFLYDKSKSRNLMTAEQLSKILIDNNTEMLIDSSSPLKLEEGYELELKSINVNETKAILELKKNGQVIDTKIIQPSILGATVTDKTYYYKKDLGSAVDIVILAVHFKNVFHGANKDSGTIDGIFQISDSPTSMKTDLQYNKMSIRNVDPTSITITMDNKDNQIILNKNKDVVLMQNIHIKTADQDGTAATPLRYYIYSEEPCKC